MQEILQSGLEISDGTDAATVTVDKIFVALKHLSFAFAHLLKFIAPIDSCFLSVHRLTLVFLVLQPLLTEVGWKKTLLFFKMK